MQARHADHGVDLIERAIGFDAQIVFLAPLAGAERGSAIVTAAGIDPVEDDHSAQPFAIQIAIMIMTIATNCMSTRSRISFCDVCGEPPRIMLTRPKTKTMATAMTAIGTRA